MTRCYLGLGSNLRSPERQLRRALQALRKLPNSIIKAISSIYLTPPLGVKAQPRYCNMVIAIDTSLAAHRLLTHCQRIEHAQERYRKKHWGARTLDIDLLLYGNQSINHVQLMIPHPHMLTRDFVLYPLLEIAPFASLPDGQSIAAYCKETGHDMARRC